MVILRVLPNKPPVLKSSQKLFKVTNIRQQIVQNRTLFWQWSRQGTAAG
jgi:hypothetical protein